MTAFQPPILQQFRDPLSVFEIGLLTANRFVVLRIDQHQL
jgi:hypothetical protein